MNETVLFPGFLFRGKETEIKGFRMKSYLRETFSSPLAILLV